MSWFSEWRHRRAMARAPRVHGDHACMRCKRAIDEWCGRCGLHGYVCFRCVVRKPLRSSIFCPTCKSELQQYKA